LKEAKRITEAIVVVFVVAAAGFVFGTAILIDVLGIFWGYPSAPRLGAIKKT
jgi:hypothetical protein